MQFHHRMRRQQHASQPHLCTERNFSISATSAGTSGLNMFSAPFKPIPRATLPARCTCRDRSFSVFGVPFDLPLTGTIDAMGHLNATIAGSNNQTITLNATVSPDGALLSNGDYSVAGQAAPAATTVPSPVFRSKHLPAHTPGLFSPSASTSVTLTLALTPVHYSG